jgi:L-fucose isomerase-like protein
LIDSAELKAKEERERDAEEIEIGHVNKQVKRLIRAGFTREEAKELFQTERGKVTKNVQEHKISIAPETQGMLKEAITFLPFLNSSKKKGGGKK